VASTEQVSLISLRLLLHIFITTVL